MRKTARSVRSWLKAYMDDQCFSAVRRIVFFYVRLRFHVIGNPAALEQRQGAGLIVANHISIFDPLIISAYLQNRTIWWVAAKEFSLFETAYDNYVRKYADHYPRWCIRAVAWSAVWIIRHSSVILIDPGQHKDNRKAVRHIVTLLKSGEYVALFPQGGIRSNDQDSEKYQEARPAYLSIVRYGQASIFPVRIERRRVVFFDAIEPPPITRRRTKQDRQEDELMHVIKERILT